MGDPVHMSGRTVRLFLVDGHMGGIVTAQIPGWTGRLVTAPADRLDDLCDRPEAKRTGVRLFVGSSGRLTRILVVSGSDLAEDLATRPWEPVIGHLEHVVLVTDMDDMLTRDVAAWMADYVHGEAGSVGCDMVQRPSCMIPISEAARADLERFMEHVRIALPALGHRMLSSPPLPR